jgi:hypothetical protein
VVPVGRSSDAGESVRTLLKDVFFTRRFGAGQLNWRKIALNDQPPESEIAWFPTTKEERFLKSTVKFTLTSGWQQFGG